MKSILILALLLSSVSLQAEEVNNIDLFIKRFKTNLERPRSCPMESKNYSDLLASTENIKSIFKSNCLQKDEKKMSEVLGSVKEIQDELKKRNLIVAPAEPANTNGNTSTSAGTSTSSAVSALSGIKFSNLFSNITSMIKKNQCDLSDGRVLEMTADLVYDSTQLGLLSGSELGLVVAGGGFMISSAMRLIDMIIKQRFNFEKIKDRQTFIKLNCSFYDIRHDLENEGVLDVETNSAKEDLKNAREFIEKTIQDLDQLEKEKSLQRQSMDQLDQQTLKALVGEVLTFKRDLLDVRNELKIEAQTETEKLKIIASVAQKHNSLNLELVSYRRLKISTIPMLDDLFAQELKNFDSLNESLFLGVLNLELKDFNNNLRSKMLFHVDRIIKEIEAKELIAARQNQGTKVARSKNIETRQKDLEQKLADLKKIEERLNKVVSEKDYSAIDDGTDNIVSILENYKNISGQIYGVWGEKFLRYTSQKSVDETRVLNDRVLKFSKSYLDNKSAGVFQCQDIQKLRSHYKYAESLIQEGYDFIATNKDLFSTFSDKYYSGIEEEQSAVKIQGHYKSILLAFKKINNQEVSKEDEDKYLSRNLIGTTYLGTSMLVISNTKSTMQELQNIFEKLNCNNVLSSDLN